MTENLTEITLRICYHYIRKRNFRKIIVQNVKFAFTHSTIVAKYKNTAFKQALLKCDKFLS